MKYILLALLALGVLIGCTERREELMHWDVCREARIMETCLRAISPAVAANQSKSPERIVHACSQSAKEQSRIMSPEHAKPECLVSAHDSWRIK